MSTLSLANLAGRKTRPISGTTKAIFLVAIVAAIIAFVVGVASDKKSIWTAFLTNYMLFTQFGMVGLVFAAIANITNSTWMRPMKRIAEGFTTVLPVSLILLFVLFIGRDNLWHWAHVGHEVHAEAPAAEQPESTAKKDLPGIAVHYEADPDGFLLPHDPDNHHGPHLAHVKHWWLNEPFFWGRSFAIVIIFNLLAFFYRRRSMRPDLGAVAELEGRKIDGWQGVEKEVEKSQHTQKILAPIVGLIYAIGWSIHSFDLLLSIDWTFPDAMFGAWQFTTGLLALWALTNLFMSYYRKKAYLDDLITGQQYHDVGKLMFGFGIFWTYIMWSQYLPIWYGNLPEEAPYVLLRVNDQPWRSVSILLPFIIWLIPFWTLMAVKAKKNPVISGAMALLILAGIWLERYVLSTATLYPREVPLGILDIVLTAGFVGGFLLLVTSFLGKNPILPVTDPYLKAGGDHH